MLIQVTEETDKRVSTGSITSLKRMWEKERAEKQQQQQQQQMQLQAHLAQNNLYKEPKSSSSDSAYHTSATTTPVLDRKGVRRTSDAKKWPPGPEEVKPAEPGSKGGENVSKPQVPVKPAAVPLKQKSPPTGGALNTLLFALPTMDINTVHLPCLSILFLDNRNIRKPNSLSSVQSFVHFHFGWT
jgi:hypothetical protein